MALFYKYFFEIPKELQGVNPQIDVQGSFIIYAGDERSARKAVKKSALDNYNIKIKSKLKLIKRERW